MSHTIYTSGTWPVLQSRREQKFLSGLIAASADYISPVGDTSMPTEIPSSVGSLDIYPLPTISIDTSGFQKISATAYGVWSETVSEERINRSAIKMPVFFWVDGNAYEYTTPVIIESGWVKKMGDSVPTLSRAIAIIAPRTYLVTEFRPQLNPAQYTGSFSAVSPTIATGLVSVRQNQYGSIVESEAVYELTECYVNFGYFDLIPT